MESIKVLIENLSQKNNQKYCQTIFDEFESNAAFISKNYKKDSVSEDSLLKLLKSSIENKLIKWFIPDILFLVDENSISDNVFEQCFKYPGRYRKTLLTQLGHMWLKREQLEKLNQVLETPEAFYKLLLIYLRDSKFSANQLREFLLNNERYLNEILNYKKHLSDQEISREKIILIDQIIQK